MKSAWSAAPTMMSKATAAASSAAITVMILKTSIIVWSIVVWSIVVHELTFSFFSYSIARKDRIRGQSVDEEAMRQNLGRFSNSVSSNFLKF